MKILLAYATYSGSTQTASEEAEKKLTELSHTVELKNIQEVSPDDMNEYDLVLLATPSWSYEGKDGQPHAYFMEFLEKAKGKTFPGKKFAIMGMGDTAYPNFCGAADVLLAFVKEVQGVSVVEPLKIDGFFFNQEENTKHIYEWVEKLHKTLAPS